MYYVKNYLSLIFILVGLSYCQTGTERAAEITSQVIEEDGDSSSLEIVNPPTVQYIDGIEHFAFYTFKIGDEVDEVGNESGDVLFKILLSGEQHNIQPGKIVMSLKEIH
jgi:hypothetical protein